MSINHSGPCVGRIPMWSQCLHRRCRRQRRMSSSSDVFSEDVVTRSVAPVVAVAVGLVVVDEVDPLERLPQQFRSIRREPLGHRRHCHLLRVGVEYHGVMLLLRGRWRWTWQKPMHPSVSSQQRPSACDAIEAPSRAPVLP